MRGDEAHSHRPMAEIENVPIGRQVLNDVVEGTTRPRPEAAGENDVVLEYQRRSTSMLKGMGEDGTVRFPDSGDGI